MRTIYWEKNIPKIVITNLLQNFWPGVIWSPFSATRYAEFPDPPLPGSKWIRVRNRQCGICASDLSTLYVKPVAELSLAALPSTNRVFLGHELVGEIVELGSDVTRYEHGDRVVMEARPAGSPNCFTQEIQPLCEYCQAGQTRFCTNASAGSGPEGIGGGWGSGFIAHESEVWPVPRELNDDQASLIEPCAVCLHTVLRKLPKPGDQVLVIGGGTIGLLTVQLAKILAPTARLTCLVKYPHQAEVADRFGADNVVFLEGNPYPRMAEISRAKAFRFPMNRGALLGGFDIVYDCIGSQSSIWDGLRWAKARGTFVLAGVRFQSYRMDLSPVWHQEVDFLGSLTFGLESWHGQETHTFEIICEMLRTGQLQIEALITHRFSFDDYKRAIRAASDRRAGAIKVTLEYTTRAGSS
jgi:threonine dehydrogenase-like Zn-dependent dehydrogenase